MPSKINVIGYADNRSQWCIKKNPNGAKEPLIQIISNSRGPFGDIESPTFSIKDARAVALALIIAAVKLESGKDSYRTIFSIYDPDSDRLNCCADCDCMDD